MLDQARGVAAGVHIKLAQHRCPGGRGEIGTEPELRMMRDRFLAPLGIERDRQQFGQRRVEGVTRGHEALAGESDERCPLVTHRGGDELLGLWSEYLRADVAEDDDVEGLPLLQSGGQKLGFVARVFGRGADGSGAGDAGDEGGREQHSLNLHPLIAGERGGKIAEFPARAIIDIQGVKLVFFDAHAECGDIVLRVHFAGHFGDAHLVAYGGGGFGGLVGKIDRIGLVIGGRQDGLTADDKVAALEFDLRGLAGETVEPHQGAGLDRIALVDPVGGIHLFHGGIG